MKDPFLFRTVILLAVSVGVAACGSASGTSSPVTTPTPAATDAPTKARSTAAPTPAPVKTDDGFSKALTAWKAAAAAPTAMMNTYLQQAATDLKASGNSSYNAAISELAYLASLPATGLSSAQVAQAQSDEKELDKFFGTPGLLD